MPTVETNGFETYYERHGEGPTLVLSHGSGWDSRSWLPQVRGLSTDYEVVTYDVRGHGRSGSPGEELDALAVLADDLRTLVDALNLESPVVGGCSMGGRIAYTYAARYPTALDALITQEAPVVEEGLTLGRRLLLQAMRRAEQRIGPKRVFDAFATIQSMVGDDEYADQRVPGLGMAKREYVDDARGRWMPRSCSVGCWLIVAVSTSHRFASRRSC